MEVTFQLEPDDLWRFSEFVTRRVPAFWLLLAARILMMPLIVGALAASLTQSSVLGLLIFIGIELFWVPLVFWSNRRYSVKVINGRPGTLDLQTIQISAEGLRHKTSLSESVMSWQSFVEVAEHSRFIVFFLDKRYGIVVPRRAFTGDDAFKRFYECSLAFWKGLPVPSESQVSDVWPPPPRTLKP